MKPSKPMQPHQADQVANVTHPPGSRGILYTLSILLPALLLSTGFAADLPIYTDSLLNGWENWSWATVNLSAGAPVHSGTASISVFATNFQALYLHHSALDGSQYSSIALWIDGGSTGGQPLQVQATRNGVAGPAVMLALPPVDSWQQVVIPLQSLGVANATDFDGFWVQVQSSGSQPAFYVDDIHLTAIPEPSVWTLVAMLGGCGIWFAGLRRPQHFRMRRGSAG